jgi:hypothetical protein
VSFGTQTFGSQTYGSEGGVLTVTAISLLRTSWAGGEKIVLTGTFSLTKTYTVSVGGVAAYSGVLGQGNVVLTADGLTIAFVMPRQSGVGAKTVLVTESPGGATDTIGIDALERVFAGTVFAVRHMFPSWYAAGPRRLDLEPPEVP